MPRYFFDLHDETGASPDTDGQELESLLAAEAEAIRSLGSIAADTLVPDEPARLSIHVRDETGPLFVVHLTIEVLRGALSPAAQQGG
jgi:hypothetical protein